MSNSNASIELSSQPSSSSPLHRAHSPAHLGPSHGHFGYLPQEDEDHHQSPQIPPINPQRPQSSSLEDKLKACVEGMFKMDLIKATKITFYLIVLFYIVDLVPLYLFTAELLSDVTYTPHIRGALEFMSINLKADPIMDIKIIDKKSACPSGFEPLKLSTWPGTVAGCLCENGDLFSSPCDKAQSEKCHTVPGTHAVDIYEINNSIWCVKRAVPDQEYVKKMDCPAGYKECYVGGCFVGDCPLTKIEISSNGALVLAKTQGELPLVDIKATPNDVPCFNQDFSPNSPGENSLYKLLITKENGCGKHGLDNISSQKLNTKSIFDSYTQNSYRYSVMNLPYYEKYAKNTMSVMSWRTRIMTAKNDYCLTLDEKLLRDSIKMFSHSFPSEEVIFNAVIAHVMVFLMIVLCRFCCGCCISNSDEFFRGLSRSGVSTFRVLGMFYIPILIRCVVRIDDYRQLKVLTKYFEEFNLLGCFGEGQGSLVIHDYLEILKMGEYQYLMFFGLTISYGIPILIFCWFLLVRKISSPQISNLSDLPRV